MKTKVFGVVGLCLLCAQGLEAQEIQICINVSDQYAVLASQPEDCLEGESITTLSGPGMEVLIQNELLSSFADNSECDGEGFSMELGFDSNRNGELDLTEVMTASSSCTPSPD